MPQESIAKRLALALQPLQESIRDMRCRIVPSSFDSSDEALLALPLPREWSWPTFEAFMKRAEAQTLIQQMPSFWQAEPFAHFASRRAGTPVAIVEPQNYPLDKALIRFASADAVLAEAGEAGAIAAYLTAEHLELPPYWYLVYSAEAASFKRPDTLRDKNLTVALEVQLAPSITLMYQCEHISKGLSGFFHQSEQFVWNDDPKSPKISTKEGSLYALKDFALPFSLQHSGTCACGKNLFERI